MARPKKIEKQRFCVRGHDTLVTGRTGNSNCVVCKKSRKRVPTKKHIKQFCPRGHDTLICGRDKWSKCRGCQPLVNEKRRGEVGRLHRKLHPPNKEYFKKYREEHKEELRLKGKIWRRKNTEKLKLKQRKYRAENREKVKRSERSAHLRRKFGLTIEQFEQMLWEQEFRCLGCNIHQSELKKPLAVDHDHKTGEVRGLLCDPCNFALGCVKDDIKILLRLIKYLN